RRPAARGAPGRRMLVARPDRGAPREASGRRRRRRASARCPAIALRGIIEHEAPPGGFALIDTGRIVLREWRDDDLDAFAALNADPAVMEHMPKLLTSRESDETAMRIRKALEDRGWGLWAVEAPGVARFCGFVGLQPVPFETHFTPRVEVGWRLARAHWG